jgi:MFS family permease
VLPSVFRHRNFALYFLGVVFSHLGSRATVAANLWLIYQLTSSLLEVGLVGLFQAAALLLLSPLGGAFADRLDRRRLLQVTQLVALVAAAALAVLEASGVGGSR